MINSQRVKMMTDMQILLDEEGEELRPMMEYYRVDYVAKQVLLSILSGTLIFVIVCVLVFTEDIEAFLLTIDLENLAKSMSPRLVRYGIFMAVYLAITMVVYSFRYSRGRRKVKKYYNQLLALEKQYKEEERHTKPTGGFS